MYEKLAGHGQPLEAPPVNNKLKTALGSQATVMVCYALL